MKQINKYFNLILGLFLVAIAFNLFLLPYNLAAGGVSGLSLILHKIFGINESIFIFLTNLFLLLISYLFLGKNSTQKTIIGSLLFPILIDVTGKISFLIKINDIEVILIAALGGIISGIGYGLIFKSGYTSGGTDIINQIMEKYFHMPISKSIIIIDGLITILSYFTFGFSTMIYSLVSLFLISIFSNKAIIGIGLAKTLYIYSNKIQKIKAYLHEELKIDSTDIECTSGYRNRKNKIILSVIDNKNYYRIKEAIQLLDSEAFIVVTNSYHLANANVSIRK